MDRRDFLKMLGLLAATAPAGIAALKQAPVAPEAPAPSAAMFADITKAAKESAATVGAMADSAFDCLEAMAEDREVMRGKVLTPYLERFALKH